MDLLGLAEWKDILVQGKPPEAEGVSGMLLRHGNSFGIIYATQIKSLGFQRFSIAHELGHYFLPGHPEALIGDGDGAHVSQAEFRSADVYEREADYFASGLLMPTGPFTRELNRLEDGLDAVLTLADRCVTSRTSTAIRYADLTKGAVAVIATRGDVIDFAFMSERMKRLPDIRWPKKGDLVPQGVTARMNADPLNIKDRKRMSDGTDLSDWLGGPSVEGLEECLGLGSYGRSLTVLTCSSIKDDTYGEEEDEDALLEESWTPRFR